MNPGRYFIPNMSMGSIPSTMSMQNGFVAKNSLFSTIANRVKDFNWSGILNGANKTLNVVNQTIPLIRQTKPMVDNAKNMFSLAKAFRKETAPISKINVNSQIKKEVIDSGYPNFFI